MSAKNKAWDYHSLDTPEQINKCLNCKRSECSNCVALPACKYDKALAKGLSENEMKYHMVLNAADKAFLEYYPIYNTDREIGAAIGKSPSGAHTIREKLGLPISRTLSREARTELVKKWIA